MGFILVIRTKGGGELLDRYSSEDSAKDALRDLIEQIHAPATSTSKYIYTTKSGRVALQHGEFVSATIVTSAH